jgi:hypothetical protein
VVLVFLEVQEDNPSKPEDYLDNNPNNNKWEEVCYLQVEKVYSVKINLHHNLLEVYLVSKVKVVLDNHLNHNLVDSLDNKQVLHHNKLEVVFSVQVKLNLLLVNLQWVDLFSNHSNNNKILVNLVDLEVVDFLDNNQLKLNNKLPSWEEVEVLCLVVVNNNHNKLILEHFLVVIHQVGVILSRVVLQHLVVKEHNLKVIYLSLYLFRSRISWIM